MSPADRGGLKSILASAQPDEVIMLGAGRYVLPEPLVLERSVALLGEPGRSFIDAQGAHTAIVTSGVKQHYRFEHLVFEHGAGELGGAVFSPNRNILEFADCRFIENRSSKDGAALAMEQTKGFFRRCAFVRNKAAGGGALALGRLCDVEIDRCIFVGNEADVGGAVFISDNAALIVKSATFVGNRATRANGGGAVFVFGAAGYGPTAHFSNCVFSGESPFGADPKKKLKVYITNSVVPPDAFARPNFENKRGNTVGAPRLLDVGTDLYALAAGSPGAGTADVSRIEKGALDINDQPLVNDGTADPGALARP